MKKTNLAFSEKLICERIERIYFQQLEQQLQRINCRIFDRVLVLLLEGVITPPENLLNRHNHPGLANKVRSVFDRIIQLQIKDAIEQTLNVTVTDFLCDTAIETGRTGAIVIFEFQSLGSSSGICDD